MIDTFLATLSPMLVLFICMIIGFILNKKKMVPADAATVLSKLENYVLVPALIINTFMRYCTVASISEQYKLILYSVVALFIALVIALPLSKVFCRSGYIRNIYKYALTFGNFSFMGNAIVPAIMGEEMLYGYMLYILPLNVAVYTWGIFILIPHDEKGSPFKNLLNPVFFAIVIGAALGLSGASKYVPDFLSSALSNLSACMGPLAMVLTGFVIGNYNMKELVKNKKVYIASLLRMFIIPTLLIGILLLLKADRNTLFFTLFAFATPLGLNTVVFPAAYGGDSKTGASMAMVSHTLCVITIPIMYSLLELIV